MVDELTRASVLDNRYIILKLLGQGGMGQVYLAQDNKLQDQLVALKLLSANYVSDPRSKERFLREVLLARKVSHPNIVRTHDIGECEQGLYLTMEYAEGASLKDLVARGPVQATRALDILLQIAKGLEVIHNSGIVHRDLKSANIILTKEGQAKISDFGIASPGQSEMTTKNELLGSCHYMAPEIWSGGEASQLSDLYAFGVLAYELVCGILPFEGFGGHELMFKHLKQAPTAPLDLIDNIPIELNNLILDLLAKNAEDRPENVKSVLQRLENARLNPITEDLIFEDQSEYAEDYNVVPCSPVGEEFSSGGLELGEAEPAIVNSKVEARPTSLEDNFRTAAAANVAKSQSEVSSDSTADQIKKRPGLPKISLVIVTGLYFLMLLFVSFAVPTVIKFLDPIQAASNSTATKILLSLNLLLVCTPFYFFQFSLLSLVGKIPGESVSLKRAFRFTAISIVLAMMLFVYYLVMVLYHLQILKGELELSDVWNNAYQVARAVSLNMFEVLAWQTLPAAFAANRLVGRNLQLELTGEPLLALFPVIMAFLLLFCAAFIAVRFQDRKMRISKMKVLLLVLVAFLIGLVTELITRYQSGYYLDASLLNFSNASFNYSYENYFAGLIVFAILAKVAIGKK